MAFADEAAAVKLSDNVEEYIIALVSECLPEYIVSSGNSPNDQDVSEEALMKDLGLTGSNIPRSIQLTTVRGILRNNSF